MYKIAKAETQDVEGIQNVLQQSWLDTYVNPEKGISEEAVRNKPFFSKDYSKKIIEDLDRYWVAKDQQDRVVGLVNPQIINKRCRVGRLYVIPEAKGQGLGKQLLQIAIDYWKGKDVYVEVVEYNQKAIDFYLKNGFQFENPKVVTPYWVSESDNAWFNAVRMVHPASSPTPQP